MVGTPPRPPFAMRRARDRTSTYRIATHVSRLPVYGSGKVARLLLGADLSPDTGGGSGMGMGNRRVAS